MNLPAALSYLLFLKMHPKGSRGEKMVSEVSKIQLHEKVDDKQKKLQSIYKNSKLQPISFFLPLSFSQMSAKPLTKRER